MYEIAVSVVACVYKHKYGVSTSKLELSPTPATKTKKKGNVSSIRRENITRFYACSIYSLSLVLLMIIFVRCSVAAAPTTAATSAIFFRIVFDLSDVSVVGIPFVRFFVHFIVKAAAFAFHSILRRFAYVCAYMTIMCI